MEDRGSRKTWVTAAVSGMESRKVSMGAGPFAFVACFRSPSINNNPNSLRCTKPRLVFSLKGRAFIFYKKSSANVQEHRSQADKSGSTSLSPWQLAGEGQSLRGPLPHASPPVWGCSQSVWTPTLSGQDQDAVFLAGDKSYTAQPLRVPGNCDNSPPFLGTAFLPPESSMVERLKAAPVNPGVIWCSSR